MTFRLHVVSLPHTNTTRDFSACAFTERVRKFCDMMHAIMGYTVYLYAGEQNDASVTEHIPCFTESQRQQAVGDKHFIHASFDPSAPHWQVFNRRVIHEIRLRIQPHDIICVIGGNAHKQIADAFPNHITVEFSIGYGGTFAKFRVWESYAWMHTCYGAAAGDPNHADGRFFDDVIPGSFNPDEFTVRDRIDKSLDLFFIGRLTERKGPHIAVEVAKRMNMELVVAGQGEPPDDPCVKYIGVIDPEERNYYMSRAHAVIVPTLYVEPFGNVAVEAQLCGTPAITTDWGAFTETVVNGKTGFRCRTLQEFCDAVYNASHLRPHDIRKHAEDRYSYRVIAERYDRYFRRLSSIWEEGWYA